MKPLEYKRISHSREGDYKRLETLCHKGLRRIYGVDAAIEGVDENVRTRLQKELASIKENENAYYYLRFYDLIHTNNINPSQYNLRGTSASVLVSHLLEISHVNPLDEEVPLYREFFQGIKGDKSPDIDMNFDSKVWKGLNSRHDDTCSLNARLYEATGYYPTDEDIRSEEILALFTNCEGLGTPRGRNCGMKSGLLAIPGLMNEFTLMLIDTLQPKTIAELVRLEAKSYGANTWFGNGEILFADGKATIADLIGTREDVLETMLAYGIDMERAFTIAENVRKGRMKPEFREMMFMAGVPDWYIWSSEKVKYLSSRAYAAEQVQMKLRILYYKLHYPEVFYQVFSELYRQA